MELLINSISSAWMVFRESSFYMLFGFFVSAILYACMKPDQIAKHLGKGKVKPVLLSALFGIPIPLCSCGVIPAAAELKRQGANKGATLSFLISTPESGVDSISVSYALLDPIMTLLRPVSGFFTAVVAGIAENFFNARDEVQSPALKQSPSCSGNCCQTGCKPDASGNGKSDSNISFMGKFSDGLTYAFVDLLHDIGGWFLVGIALAGLVNSMVPESFIESFSQNHFMSMLIMLAAGIPMYVCATASTPIAAALIIKGLNPGAALVFLIVGPATNIASISMITGLLGRRTLLIYLSSIIVCALFMGFVTDAIYSGFGIAAKATVGKSGEFLPAPVELISALILAGLLTYSFFRPFINRKSKSS